MAANAMQDALKVSRRFTIPFRREAEVLLWTRQISRKDVKVSVEIGERNLQFSSGKLAFLADGSTVVKYGDTQVLVTSSSSKKPKELTDFMPLMVDYNEKSAALGIIPKNFFRRDLKSDYTVSISRSIDRCLRPLFPKGYLNYTQVMATLLAFDNVNDPDIMAINGASAALTMSDIPWDGPVGAVRVGEVDGKCIINPSPDQLNTSSLNLIVACTSKKIVMLEAYANEINNNSFCEAVRFGFNEAQPIIRAITALHSLAGKEKREFKPLFPSEELYKAVYSFVADRLNDIFSNTDYKKLDRDERIFKLSDDCVDHIKEELSLSDDQKMLINQAFHQISREVLRNNIMEKNQRCDGRSIRQLRDLKCEVGLYKSLHGSALFDRGETQVFSTVTKGSLSSAVKLENVQSVMNASSSNNFMLQYEFPPYATNDVRFMGTKNRREIGHGLLAERALLPVLPKDSLYTLRVTAGVLASNGSSSMAAACAGSLALMNAGVNISKHVAGTACGLVASEEASDPNKIDFEYKILTDIMGMEDYLGEMDFKIAGTRDGITSLQFDSKLPGLPISIIEETVQQSSEDRMKVLDVMEKTISGPVNNDYSPISEQFEIPAFIYGRVVGPKGRNIIELEEQYGIKLTQNNDDTATLFAPNKKNFDLAMKRIESIMENAIKPRFEQRRQREYNNSSQQFQPKQDKNISVENQYDYIEEISIPMEYFGHVVGRGGKNIKLISDTYGIRLSRRHDGTVILFAPSKEIFDQALQEINKCIEIAKVREGNSEESTKSLEKSEKLETSQSVNDTDYSDLRSRLEKGGIYAGRITKISQHGIHVSIFPGLKNLLLHKDRLSDDKIHPGLLGFKIGEFIEFKYIGDDRLGRPVISRKALYEEDSVDSELLEEQDSNSETSSTDSSDSSGSSDEMEQSIDEKELLYKDEKNLGFDGSDEEKALFKDEKDPSSQLIDTLDEEKALHEDNQYPTSDPTSINSSDEKKAA